MTILCEKTVECSVTEKKSDCLTVGAIMDADVFNRYVGLFYFIFTFSPLDSRLVCFQ